MGVEVRGRHPRIARVKSEAWLEGQPVHDPRRFAETIKSAKIGADIFTFEQKLPETEPLHMGIRMEMDNVSAIPLTSYDNWWSGLSQVSRKNVRRAKRKGVEVRLVEFVDKFVDGIIEVHNDTPIRQGGKFSHYKKDFATVKKDYGSFLTRSQFFGAYCGDELIGFTKVVFMGKVASILNILTKTAHYDKRPTNALIAKIVEHCAEQKCSHIVYGKYTYGNKTECSLTEFKRRNGFEKIYVPRYFMPLTLKGIILMRMRLHRGLIGFLPSGLIPPMLKLRAKINRIFIKRN